MKGSSIISAAHLKWRLGQYAALWLGGFLLGLIAIAVLSWVLGDLIEAVDWVLPPLLLLTGAAYGGGVVITLISKETLGTKLLVVALALLMLLPLLWAPVLSAVVAAYVADRSIEYSQAYAAFRIAVSNLLYPLAEWLGSGGWLDWLWSLFQWVSTVVGFLSAWAKIWPGIRRFLGPEPEEA